MRITDSSHEDPAVLVEIDWQPWILELAGQAGEPAAVCAHEARRVAHGAGMRVLATRYLSQDASDPLRADSNGHGARFLPGLEPEPGEPPITKHGRDVWEEADFRARIEDASPRIIWLTGLLTGHGVESAARGALRRGIAVTVVAEACADTDPESHDAALLRLSEAGAAVRTVAELRVGGGLATEHDAPLRIAEVARCRASGASGRAMWRLASCPQRPSSASASCRIRRSGAASSPGR